MKQQLLLRLVITLSLLVMAPLSVAAQEQPTAGPTPRQPQIVGGQPATPGEFPWQVMLLRGSQKEFWCGGSLIAPRWVLTAAHCLGDIRHVALGAHRYGGSTNEAERQVIAVKREIGHPQYDVDQTVGADIALLELATPATLNSRVQLVPLVALGPDDSLWSAGRLVTISGWGATGESGGDPAVLQKVTVPMVDQTACNQAYEGRILKDMVCAGVPEGGRDSCFGDSGGPLVAPEGSGRWKLAGVVSWGSGCARPGLPGVYTSVAFFRQWIDANMPGEPPTPTPGPTVTPVPTPTATPTLSPTPPVANLVKNGDFEAGNNGDWQQQSSNHYLLIDNGAPVAPHSGQSLAWLGGAVNEKSRLRQTVTLPAGAKMALRYYYQINADPACQQDQAKVFVNKIRLLTHSLCTGNGNWQPVTIDLSAYAGQSVTLQFFAQTRNGSRSNFFVDDVAIAGSDAFKDAATMSVAEGVEDEEATADADQSDSTPLTPRQRSNLYLPLAQR